LAQPRTTRLRSLRLGISKQLRLKQADDFARLRRAGRTYRHRLLLLSVLPNEVGHNRYGLITGKKLGNAAKRNRVRRLLREALRHRHADLNPGHDLVIVAHPGAVGQPYEVIRAAVDELLQQAGLLHHPGL
jgi:ribonuclease P protein component